MITLPLLWRLVDLSVVELFKLMLSKRAWWTIQPDRWAGATAIEALVPTILLSALATGDTRRLEADAVDTQPAPGLS